MMLLERILKKQDGRMCTAAYCNFIGRNVRVLMYLYDPQR
jgi:hypothetical protein